MGLGLGWVWDMGKIGMGIFCKQSRIWEYLVGMRRWWKEDVG